MLIQYIRITNDLRLRGKAQMRNKVVFINPNTTQDIERYLPKILAEAIVNKVIRDTDTSMQQQYDANNRHD